MKLARSFALASLSVALAGCAGVDVRPAADIHVAASAPSPEVDAIVASFYGGGALPPGFAAQLADALAKNPRSGLLHEVAAYWAILHSDDHGAWEHFLLAAADTRNPDASIDILELGRANRTRSEELATIETLARIAQESPDVEAQASARYMRAAFLRVLGRHDDAAHEIAALGFVRDAELLGAFDNEDGKGLAEAYPPETKVDVTATASGSVVPIRWRVAHVVDARGSIPLGYVVHPNQGAVAYVAFWVQAPQAGVATLRLSTDAPVATWVNHSQVLREDDVQHWAFDNVTETVRLAAGWNEVLVKSAVKTGTWNLGARFTDAAGAPVPGLVLDASPHEVGSGGVRGSVAPSTKATGGGPREAFVAARRRMILGHHKSGLAAFEKVLTAQPSNPLLRFFTADADERDHQRERALDLLSSGITAEEALPAFLQARARLYLEKELLTQADRDLLRVIREQPRARMARLELAEVLTKLTWQADRVATLLDVTRKWPDSAAAWIALGAAREAQGYGANAEQAYRTAAALEPSSTTALRALRRILEARGASSAVEDVFAQLEEQDPGDITDQLARAEHDRTRGKPGEALARLLAISRESPDHPTPYLREGQLAEERGDEAAAIALFQRAEERDPKDSWLAQRLEHLRPPTEDALRPYVATDEQIDRAVHRPTVKGDAASHGDTASHVQTLLADTATLLSSDGSVRMVVTEVLRALTQRGRDELVRLPIPGGEAVRVLNAYALTSDGRRQEASSVEKSSVRFRNLDIGSTVVLQYAAYPRRTGALADDYFHDTPFSLVGRHIDRMRWVVVASKRKPLYVDADARITHTVTDAGDWAVHEFVRENVPAIPAEVSMVPAPDLAAHAVVTTVPSWDSYIRWEKAILDESFPVDPTLDALAQRLTLGAVTPREKLGKLFAFAAQEIRYQQEYESILAGWQPHRSSVVLERKYGDCKDKATLLIALARAVGIEVRFVVLATHGLGHPDRSVVLPRFNHAIAYVPVQPGFEAPLFLDATVDALDLWNLRADDQGAAGLVLDPKTGSWSWADIPFQEPTFQSQRWKIDVTVTSPEKVSARAALTVRGTQASHLRTALRSEDQSRQVYDFLASAFFAGSRVLTATAPDHESLAHPLAIDLDLDLAGTIRQEGEHYRLKLPNNAENAQTKVSDRQTPLDLGPPQSTETEVVVHFGPEVKLHEKPAAVDVSDPCFRARRTVTSDAHAITVKDELVETCNRVAVEDYPRFRAAMDHARALLDEAIVFDKVEQKKK
jgi:transglutaminase-like putative cysteine protease/tetratricopeptide (TPR) repeat protein